MRDYCGWRARIGLIYMASSTVMEPEFVAMAPDGVTIHTARLHLTAASAEGISSMMNEGPLEEATRLLSYAPLSSLVFGGTSASFLEGKGYDEAVCARMRKITGAVPVTTTSTAAVAALHAVGARRITFIGPYIDEVTERGRRFFQAHGFEVLSAHGLGITNDIEIGNVPLERVYAFVRERADAAANAVFISCTNFRSVGAIEALEQDLGVPVVSAIQSSFWHVLRLAGVGTQVGGFGSLFAHREIGEAGGASAPAAKSRIGGKR